jgi:hypothetical protein
VDHVLCFFARVCLYSWGQMYSRCLTPFSKISYYDNRYDSLRIRSFGPSNLMVMVHKARPATSAILSTWSSEYGPLTCERVAIMAIRICFNFIFVSFLSVFTFVYVLYGAFFLLASRMVLCGFYISFFSKATTLSSFFHNDSAILIKT